WESRDKQDEYVRLLEEAEKRDHRKLGAELDLFSFPAEIGSGLPVFHPKGGTIRRVMEDYSRRRHAEAGYEFVNTPHVTKEDLFISSGHLEWYSGGMFPPMELDGVTYYAKPMNCPMHILIYASRGRSYRELPLRLFEFGTVYRYEKSGVVHGLTRARGFTQDDSHIFCTPEQLPAELASLLNFVVGLLRDFGLTDFEAELSTRPEKYVGELAEWAAAEAALKHALDSSGLPYVIAEGEGAFYAPKIDVHVKDAIGRRWQLSTLQVDFQEPGRFGIEYQAADGTRQRPYMIHRALFGSIERFFGILVEHYAGAFPPWLAPVQATGIPISDAHVPYLEKIAATLREQGIRVEVDDSDARMQKKIRTAQRQKVPFMLIAGDDDVAAGAVSFRFRDGSQKNGVPIADAIAEIVAAARPPRPRPGVRRSPRCVRPAVDAAPDGLHQGGGQALRSGRGRGLPVLPCAHPGRRGSADRRPGFAGLRGTQPLPLQRRPHADLPVPAPGRLHRADPGRNRRVLRVHRACHPRPAAGLRRAGLQHRHQPRLGGRRGHRRAPAPARGPQMGRRHQLHAGGRPHPRPAPAPRRHPQAPSRGLAPDPIASRPQTRSAWLWQPAQPFVQVATITPNETYSGRESAATLAARFDGRGSWRRYRRVNDPVP